jgi:hypothetical protein
VAGATLVLLWYKYLRLVSYEVTVEDSGHVAFRTLTGTRRVAAARIRAIQPTRGGVRFRFVVLFEGGRAYVPLGIQGRDELLQQVRHLNPQVPIGRIDERIRPA